MSVRSQALASLIMASSRIEIHDRRRQESKQNEQPANIGTDHEATAEDDVQSTVKIYVGLGRELFLMNKELLIKSSPFFEACLGSYFREGMRNEINFPEDDIYLFEEIKLWIEKSRLPDALLLSTKFDVLEYLDLYALAHRLMMYELQNPIVDLIRIQLLATNVMPTMWDIFSINKYHLLNSSELGRFLTECLVFDIMDDHPGMIDHDKLMLEYQFNPSESLTYVFDHMDTYQANLWSNPLELEGCRYHIHTCKVQEAHCKHTHIGDRWNYLTIPWINTSQVHLYSILLGTKYRQFPPQPSMLSSILNWFRW